MNAQEYWKFLYRDRHSINYSWYLSKRRETRREAALERKLAAAQRTIEAQATQINRAYALANVDNADALGDWIEAAQSEIANLGGQLRDIWEWHAQQSGWVIEDDPPSDLQKLVYES